MSDEGFRAQVTTHPSGLGTMPNERPEVSARMEHTLDVPRCCPVSKNPLPGSTLTIRYQVRACLLEVYALKAYIAAFKGGHADGTRNMESMVQKVAHDCAEALGVSVFVHASLLLTPEQRMTLSVTARPPEEGDDLLSWQSSGKLAGTRPRAALRVPEDSPGAESPSTSDDAVGAG